MCIVIHPREQFLIQSVPVLDSILQEKVVCQIECQQYQESEEDRAWRNDRIRKKQHDPEREEGDDYRKKYHDQMHQTLVLEEAYFLQVVIQFNFGLLRGMVFL